MPSHRDKQRENHLRLVALQEKLSLFKKVWLAAQEFKRKSILSRGYKFLRLNKQTKQNRELEDEGISSDKLFQVAKVATLPLPD